MIKEILMIYFFFGACTYLMVYKFLGKKDRGLWTAFVGVTIWPIPLVLGFIAWRNSKKKF